MVLVSHKYKFIYIKNRKVAGSSVESFLVNIVLILKKNIIMMILYLNILINLVSLVLEGVEVLICGQDIKMLNQ